jgi:hypothetical protein
MEVFPRRFAEEQIAKLIGAGLGNPLVGTLGERIKGPANQKVDVRLRGAFQEDQIVLQFPCRAHAHNPDASGPTVHIGS